MLKDDATPYEPAPASDWRTGKFSLSWLKKQASDNAHLTSAMAFLKVVGVVPSDVEFKGRNWLPSTSLPAHAIPAKYLAEVANDWDELGESSPTYFIEAIEAETAGTEKRDVVAEVLADLGAEVQESAALAAA